MTQETRTEDDAPSSFKPPPGSALADVMGLEEYRKQRVAHVLRTPESMNWFVRQHRQELLSEGALLKLNGMRVRADAFDRVLLSVGQRMARLGGAGDGA